MVSCEVIKSEKHHLNMLLENMRRMDICECLAGGLSPGRALKESFRCSYYARTAFFDGKVAAMWGLSGPVAGPIAYAWSLTTPEAERAPLTFARQARKELDLALSVKPVITAFIWSEYKQAIRFFELLGFRIEPPQPQGKHGSMFNQILIARL